jgi:hypothetical protein
MQTIESTKLDGLYVHKLRLESREGARVEIRRVAATTASRQVSRIPAGWILAKLIGVSLVATSLLVIAARELAR